MAYGIASKIVSPEPQTLLTTALVVASPTRLDCFDGVSCGRRPRFPKAAALRAASFALDFKSCWEREKRINAGVLALDAVDFSVGGPFRGAELAIEMRNGGGEGSPSDTSDS